MEKDVDRIAHYVREVIEKEGLNDALTQSNAIIDKIVGSIYETVKPLLNAIEKFESGMEKPLRETLEDSGYEEQFDLAFSAAHYLFIGDELEKVVEMLTAESPEAADFFAEMGEKIVEVVDEYKATLNTELPELPELPQIAVEQLNEIQLAVDKVNFELWDGKDEITTTDIAIPLKAESAKSKKQITNTVILCLDELKTVDEAAIQKLTQYDFRVYTGISSLVEAGYNRFSLKDIYMAMGNRSNPPDHQRKKILESVEKMSSIRITIDTSEEERANFRYNNLHITRENLLLTSIEVVKKRGQITEVIEIAKPPCLYRFAASRGAIRSIPRAVLISPISQTDETIAIENYLLHRKERAKATTFTVLFSTLYEKVGVNGKKRRQRAKEKTQRLLDHWKEQGYISDYTIGMNENKLKPEECIRIKKKSV